MKTRPCRGCGKPIVDAQIVKADGTPGLVPLDARNHPVYALLENGQAVRLHPSHLRPNEGDAESIVAFLVSHFVTCPKATDFSGSGRA